MILAVEIYHKLCFEMFVNVGHVGHDLLPVRPLYGDHFCQGQAGRHSNSLGGLESNGEVPPLLAGFESIVRDLVWHVGVKESTEGHPVIPRAGEIGNINVHVAPCLRLTPL